MEEANNPATAETRSPILWENAIGRACFVACALTIIVMLVTTAQEVASRALFNTSLELAGELGGYMLVALTFLSLALVKQQDAFQKSAFFLGFFPERLNALRQILFDIATLVVCALLVWQFSRFAIARWENGNVAVSRLATPLWLPTLPMVLGMLAYMLATLNTLCRSVAVIRKRDT